MYYSPLRYPGGKAKLAPFMEMMIKKTGHCGGVYIEPFAGGAGIALELLDKKVVNEIVINDYDKGIYSFWKSVLTETERVVEDILSVPLTVKEWERQHSICMNNTSRYSYELGFATFYMNRTNRSGIVKGGIIGGLKQKGEWKMSVRFNRGHLAKRIVEISQNKKHIHLYNKDIESFITNYLPRYERNAFVYFDPPYCSKGKQLYLNFFEQKDHERIEQKIRESVRCNWIITYDESPEIIRIYNGYACKKYDLIYSASSRRTASEIMIFQSPKMIPSLAELKKYNIYINLREV